MRESRKVSAPSTPVIGVVGAGLIGGSLARRCAEHEVTVIACDSDDTTVVALREAGITTADSVEELVAQVDVLVIAVPPTRVADAWRQVRRAAAARSRPGRLVAIDVASVKRPVVDALAADATTWADDYAVLALTHPMAGRVTSGWASSNAELFEGAAWIVCPHAEISGDELASILDLATMTGAHPCFMDIVEHDRFAAHVSHLPHLIAFAYDRLLASVNPTASWRRFGAGSLADLLRVADADPQLWEEILAGNDDELSDASDGLVSMMRDPDVHRAANRPVKPPDPARRRVEIPAASLLHTDDVAHLLATGADGLEVVDLERDGATIVLHCVARRFRGS